MPVCLVCGRLYSLIEESPAHPGLIQLSPPRAARPLGHDINARGFLISGAMNSVTRTFGKLTHRSPGDNARVSNLLNDYEDVDKLLAKVSHLTRCPLLSPGG